MHLGFKETIIFPGWVTNNYTSKNINKSWFNKFKNLSIHT